MKNILIAAFVLLLFPLAFANDPKNVKPSIRNVTVFLNRAQISGTASASIEAGTTDIILEGLPPSLDPQSIQISGKGDFIIMAVRHQMNYLDQQKKSHDFILLEDTVEKIQMELDILKSKSDVFTKEEQLLLANMSIKGDNVGVNVDALEDMADMYRDRLQEIHVDKLKNEHKIKKVNEKLEKFQNQLNELNRQRNQPTSNIIVTISAKAAKSVQLDVDYIVSNAGWYPLYDMRAKDSKSPVQVMYKAQVYQNTGVDWNNVKLKLSTSNPTQGGTKPALSPWYLDFFEERPLYKYKTGRMDAPAAAPSMQYEMKAEEREEDRAAEGISNYTQVYETTLAAEFDIALPYSIRSGGQGQLVDVQTYQLPATYVYSAVPKMDKDAFLMGRVTGWEDLNLLSGNANIYFEGTYVGQSFLNIQNTKDTLQLSLGRDKKVVIERKTIKDYTTRKMIGTNRKEDYAYEIIIRNTKKEAVEIEVEDQIPVSKNNQIEVLDVDTSGADSYDPSTGKVTWKLSLDPAQSKSLKLKYSVKYPKNRSVTGL